jgi:hypothetical protein
LRCAHPEEYRTGRFGRPLENRVLKILEKMLKLHANRNNSRADEVIANGVTIAGGATLTVNGKIGGRLNIGTTFTLISNALSAVESHARCNAKTKNSIAGDMLGATGNAQVR